MAVAKPARRVYVISDLHIGGRYGTEPGDRGFRICTHVEELVAFIGEIRAKSNEDAVQAEVVINGDLSDFLAEEFEEGAKWRAFVDDAQVASSQFDVMVRRDRIFFDALADLLADGHRLTILLGNHDVELSFPQVRAKFERALRTDGESRLRFIYDGEAYVVGDAIIEHGNRYDPFNVVDFDGLRRVRSLQSRRLPPPPQFDFRRPPGSKLVASVMNPIKARFGFIDLLKPETAAAVPLLLVLAPEYLSELRKFAAAATEAVQRKSLSPLLPSFAGDISSGASRTI